MNVAQKLTSSLLTRWLGESSADSPMQLVALEDRVLYSAGPVPVEVVAASADLLSQGDVQDVTATDLGLAPIETDGISELDDLLSQIDSASSLDSISDIQPLEDGLGGSFEGSNESVVESSALQASLQVQSSATELIAPASATAGIQFDVLLAAATAANQAPDFDTGQTTYDTPENRTFVANIDATDPEGDELFFSIIGGADADLFTITEDFGIIEFIVGPNFENPNSSDGGNTYSIQIRVEDDEGAGTNRAITINVTDVEIGEVPPNEPSDFSSSQVEYSVDENQTFVVDLDSFDPDGLATVYAIVGGVDQDLFEITAFTGVLSFRSPTDFEAPGSSDGDNTYSVRVRVQDELTPAFGTERDFTINVTNVNEAAFFTTEGSDFDVAENTSLAIDLRSEDPDNESRFYRIVGGDDAGLFNIGLINGRLNFNTLPNFEAPGSSDGDNTYSIRIRVEDNEGAGEERDFTFNVTDVNEITDFSVAENQTVVGSLASFDPDNEETTFSIVGGDDEALFEIDSDTGVITFRAAPDFEDPGSSDGGNTYSIRVLVEDDEGTDTELEITIYVTDVNEAAEFTTSQSEFNVAENQTLVGTLASSDPENDEITYSIVGGTDQDSFNIDPDNGAITFLEAPNFEAPGSSNGDNEYSIRIRVQDDEGAGTERDITINVTDVNQDLPISADNDIGEVDEGGSIEINVLMNDEINPLDRVEIVEVFNGTASFNDLGLLEFIHDGSDTLTAQVVYRIVGPEGTSDTATVDFTVSPALNIDGLDINNRDDDFDEPRNESDESDESDESVDEGNIVTAGMNPLSNPMNEVSERESSSSQTDVDSLIFSPPSFVDSDGSIVEASQQGLGFGFESNVYQYVGRTSFLDLASHEIVDLHVREVVDTQAIQNNFLSLSQFVVNVTDQHSSAGNENSILDIGNLISNNAPFLGVTALMTFTVISGLTITSTQIHRILDVGSLLDDDESIEDIVSG